MMYKRIDCPTCGNSTIAKSIEESQKCMWCRRLFKVTITKRGKKKYDWDAEFVEFESEMPRPRIKSLNEYMNRDILGY